MFSLSVGGGRSLVNLLKKKGRPSLDGSAGLRCGFIRLLVQFALHVVGVEEVVGLLGVRLGKELGVRLLHVGVLVRYPDLALRVVGIEAGDALLANLVGGAVGLTAA